VVAAGLVGTVVILVGFASGLGITRPAPASAGTNQQVAAPTSGKPAGQVGSPATGSDTGGVTYVGTPVAGLAGVPWPSWLTTWPSISGLPSGPGIGGPPPATPTSSVGPIGSPPTMPGPTTPPNCQVGLVQSVLATTTSVINGIPLSVVNGVPLIGGLAGGLVGGAPSTSGPPNPGLVGGLANKLIGACPSPSPTTSTTPGAPAAAPAPVPAALPAPAPTDLVTTTPVAGP
jgi:hypothetical protein